MEGEEVWAIARYTKPQCSAEVPTVSHRGITADRHEDKARMLMDISFPPPTQCNGDEGQEGPLCTAFQATDEQLARQAPGGTNSKKSPGPDGTFPLATRCAHDW